MQQVVQQKLVSRVGMWWVILCLYRLPLALLYLASARLKRIPVTVVGGQLFLFLFWPLFVTGLKTGSLKEEKVRETGFRPVPFLLVCFLKTGFLPTFVRASSDFQVVIEQLLWLALYGDNFTEHCLGYCQLLLLIVAIWGVFQVLKWITGI